MPEPELSIEFLSLRYSQEVPEAGLKRIGIALTCKKTGPAIRPGVSVERCHSVPSNIATGTLQQRKEIFHEKYMPRDGLGTLKTNEKATGIGVKTRVIKFLSTLHFASSI